METQNIPESSGAPLLPHLNIIPERLNHIHLIGICGTGMASLAGMLKQLGFHVTGSDHNIYPPMSTLLHDLSIPVSRGYHPDNLSPAPDLVVVGNVITKVNPEAIELAKRNLPYLSMPQAIGHFALQNKQSIVVSGTHGKTTTSAMASWVLEAAGRDPGFMIGGIPINFHRSFKIGQGTSFVVEGDEYDTAFFDKGPKFLHYRPWAAILTSIEFDHADIFRDLDHMIDFYRRFIEMIPHDGLLIANADDPVVMTESRRAHCEVVTYGITQSARWRAGDSSYEQGLTRLFINRDGQEYVSLRTPLYGRHNIQNLLAIAALANFLVIDPSTLSEALLTFQGVKRRQEIRGEKNGVMVLDDFAHHPTAVSKTIQAVKERYPDRRLIAIFEPRSNSSRRNVFQEQYSDSFDAADIIMIPEPPMMEKIPLHERFSSQKLVEDLITQGKAAHYYPATHQLVDAIVNLAEQGDIILIMSNGAFDNIHEKVLARL